MANVCIQVQCCVKLCCHCGGLMSGNAEWSHGIAGQRQGLWRQCSPRRRQAETAGSRCHPSWTRTRPETEQPWTSRLADVSPTKVTAANPLLPVLGAAASAPVNQSAPQTPRMADALQQVWPFCSASMTPSLITLTIP